MPKIGYKMSEITKEKIRKAHLNKKFTIEHKENLRKSHLGKKLSPKTIKKLIGRIPWNKGKHYPGLHKGKVKWNTGKPMTEKAKEKARVKLRISMLGNKNGKNNLGKKHPELSGKKHWNWISDRSKLKTDRQQAYDSKYKVWMKEVKNRDNWKCKINNKDCNGKLEAHHILPWSEFPKLRYNINNGISLCHFHHPRKRKDEIKLAPIFQKLVATKA